MLLCLWRHYLHLSSLVAGLVLSGGLLESTKLSESPLHFLAQHYLIDAGLG